MYLSDVVENLPERVATLADLAGTGDWAALNARLSNQVDHTDDVAEAVLALGWRSARKLSSVMGAASGSNHNRGRAVISDLLSPRVNKQ